MTLLARYTVKLFIKIYVIILVALFCMYFIMDMVTNLDRLSNATPDEISLLDTLIQYYGIRSFSLFNTINSAVILLAALGTIVGMQNKHELIALHSMGASPGQIAKPIILMATLLALAGAVNREIMLPQYQEALSRSAKNWNGEEKVPIRAKFDHRTDILIGGQYAVMSNRTIVNPRLHLHQPIGQFPRIIEAERAIYEPQTAESPHQPAGFRLVNVQVPSELTSFQSARLDEKVVIYTSADLPNLDSKDLFLSSEVPLELLVAENNHYKYSSTRDLMALLENESLDYGAHLRVQLHARMVQPVLDLTLLLLGLPFVLSGRNQNVIVSIISCVFALVCFYGVVFTCHAIGGSGYAITPTLAAWLPLFILIPAAYFVTKHIRR